MKYSSEHSEGTRMGILSAITTTVVLLMFVILRAEASPHLPSVEVKSFTPAPGIELQYLVASHGALTSKKLQQESESSS